MCSPSVIDAALAGMTRRDAIYFAADTLAGAIACVGSAAGASPSHAGESRTQPGAKRMIAADKVLDLTHTLSPTFPIWPGNEPIKVTNKITFPKAGFYANRWDVGEH